MDPIDYRSLLKKYIEHVGALEGVDFIEGNWRSGLFSDEEWAELVVISNETWEEHLTK